MRIIGLMLLVVLLVGCREQTATASPTNSAWGEVYRLGAAEQRTAPTIWPETSRVVTAWVGTDPEANTPVQTIRAVAPNILSETLPLPIPPVYPHDQHLFPAARDHFHLLWRDAAWDNRSAGTGLQGALLTPEFVPQRGQTTLIEAPVYQWAAASDVERGLFLVWSGGLRAEPELYLRYIDPIGRPRTELQLVDAADWPMATTTNDGLSWLFWQNLHDNGLYMAQLTQTGLSEPLALTEWIRLASGDRLDKAVVGLDATHAYVIWTVVRADQSVEIWFASGLLTGENWQSPSRLGVEVLPEGDFTTGFNTGNAQQAISGEAWLRWSDAITGQYGVLALAAQVDDALGVVYLQSGAIVGYQQIVPLAEPGLLDAPSIRADNNLHLHLAWALPRQDAPADFLFTMTRR